MDNKKSVIALLLTFVLLFSFVSCYKHEKQNDINEQKEESTSETTKSQTTIKEYKTLLNKKDFDSFEECSKYFASKTTRDSHGNVYDAETGENLGNLPYRTAEEWGVLMEPMKLIPGDPYSEKLYSVYSNLVKSKKLIIEAFSDYENWIEEGVYALRDLDGNGTKELITGWCRFPGEMIASEYGAKRNNWKRKIMVYDIYSIDKNGELVQWDFYGASDGLLIIDRVILKDGTIRTTNGNMYSDTENFSYRYVKMKEGNVISHRMLYDVSYINGTYETLTDINDISDDAKTIITKREFDQFRNEWEKDNPVVNLDWKPIHTYGQ